MLAIVGGFMVYISLDELLPASRIFGNEHLSILGIIAGMFLIIIGVSSFIYGVGSLNDYLTRAFGYVHFGIGIIVCICSGLEQMQDW